MSLLPRMRGGLAELFRKLLLAKVQLVFRWLPLWTCGGSSALITPAAAAIGPVYGHVSLEIWHDLEMSKKCRIQHVGEMHSLFFAPLSYYIQVWKFWPWSEFSYSTCVNKLKFTFLVKSWRGFLLSQSNSPKVIDSYVFLYPPIAIFLSHTHPIKLLFSFLAFCLQIQTPLSSLAKN